MKFDATSNEFKLLPKFFTEENYEFVNMNDHLTLMEYEKNASNCKVYVHSLDEGCGVWNKMYSVELFSPPDLHCKNWCLSHRVLSMVVRLYFKRADCFSAMITELIQKHILSGVSMVFIKNGCLQIMSPALKLQRCTN